MAHPFKVILSLTVIVGLALAAAVHFLLSGADSSVSLANLPSLDATAGQIDHWRRWFADGTADVGFDLILFASLSIIGLLLILRAVASAIVVIRQRRYLGLPLFSLPRAARPSARRAGRRVNFGRGFSGTLILAVTGTVALFGVGAAAVVYFTLTPSLREHELKRATVLALNVSDSAAGYLAAKRGADLPSLLHKFATDKLTAYIVVADRSGAVVAHNLAELPVELRPTNNAGLMAALERRTLTVAAAPVYEVAAPVLEGQAGVVRVGLWADRVEAQIQLAVAPVMIWILAVVVAGMLGAIYLVRRINRPILRLAQIASHISHGEIEIPLGGTRESGELQELSRSLERMRSSVKAALARLG